MSSERIDVNLPFSSLFTLATGFLGAGAFLAEVFLAETAALPFFELELGLEAVLGFAAGDFAGDLCNQRIHLVESSDNIVCDKS